MSLLPPPYTQHIMTAYCASAAIGVLDSVISKRTKNLALQIIHDDEHFLNSFFEKLPSGRYRSLKYRTAWGKYSFLRHLILILQEIS